MDPVTKLSPEEIEHRRAIQAEAAENRSKDFKQGGGGEKLKAKQKKLDEAKRKNNDIGGPDMMRAGMFE
eukprot:CAMPEP_0184982522 /NCGR_PEP_ID=MMETSP1098-20130426/11985_1 /TAXON_ID=89044 /ORGANISM="Spumella elongata, Strain CCAP 955/1" /LENGTH=68 /DNA_ID=CAMNT_0027506235 /DNA_START=129 /DNA_END=335 /DNA_ORIENTATION=+